MLPAEVSERRVKEWVCQDAYFLEEGIGELFKRRYRGMPVKIQEAIEELYGPNPNRIVQTVDGPDIRDELIQLAYRLRSEIQVWSGPEEFGGKGSLEKFRLVYPNAE